MVIVTVASHKGGVGKTATVHALGDVLSRRRRVLLVDCDPQASLTGSCGLAEGITPTLVNVLAGAAIGSAIYPLTPALSILPSSWALVDTEAELSGKPAYQNTLKRLLMRAAGYDLAIVDTPPGLSALTLSALTAANGVIIPTQPDAQDIRALRLMLRTVQAVQANWNIDLQVIGILPTFYSPQLTHHNAALDEIRSAGLPVLQPVGRSVRVQESSGAGLPITQYDPANARAIEYQELGHQVDKWLKSL